MLLYINSTSKTPDVLYQIIKKTTNILDWTVNPSQRLVSLVDLLAFT